MPWWLEDKETECRHCDAKIPPQVYFYMVDDVPFCEKCFNKIIRQKED